MEQTEFTTISVIWMEQTAFDSEHRPLHRVNHTETEFLWDCNYWQESVMIFCSSSVDATIKQDITNCMIHSFYTSHTGSYVLAHGKVYLMTDPVQMKLLVYDLGGKVEQ